MCECVCVSVCACECVCGTITVPGKAAGRSARPNAIGRGDTPASSTGAPYPRANDLGPFAKPLSTVPVHSPVPQVVLVYVLTWFARAGGSDHNPGLCMICNFLSQTLTTGVFVSAQGI